MTTAAVYAADPEHRRAIARDYYKRNRDQILKRKRLKYLEQSERLQERSRRWKAKNRDAVREYEAKYRKTDEYKAQKSARDREYYKRNSDKIRSRTKKWQLANPERTANAKRNHRALDREKERQSPKENPQRWRTAKRKWNRANRDRVNAYTALKRERKRDATPSWLTDDQLAEMRALYAKATVHGFHVDHIVPLCGESVCGLHVPWNLQLLSSSENSLNNAG